MTPNDPQKRKWKIEKLHVYQTKANNPGNLKLAMEYIVDLLVTFIKGH